MERLARGETGNGRDDVTSCFTHFCQEIALPSLKYSRAPLLVGKKQMKIFPCIKSYSSLNKDEGVDTYLIALMP
jgi:hypothetical protein